MSVRRIESEFPVAAEENCLYTKKCRERTLYLYIGDRWPHLDSDVDIRIYRWREQGFQERPQRFLRPFGKNPEETTGIRRRHRISATQDDGRHAGQDPG